MTMLPDGPASLTIRMKTGFSMTASRTTRGNFVVKTGSRLPECLLMDHESA